MTKCARAALRHLRRRTATSHNDMRCTPLRRSTHATRARSAMPPAPRPPITTRPPLPPLITFAGRARRFTLLSAAALLCGIATVRVEAAKYNCSVFNETKCPKSLKSDPKSNNWCVAYTREVALTRPVSPLLWHSGTHRHFSQSRSLHLR